MSDFKEVPSDVDGASCPSRCSTVFDKVTLDFMKSGSSEIQVDTLQYLQFAAREAYLHLRSRDPNVSEEDELAGQARMASFACSALLYALELSGDLVSIDWKNQ